MAAVLMRRDPGSGAWFGRETKRWWALAGCDLSVPSTVRMYDYYLGGKDNN